MSPKRSASLVAAAALVASLAVAAPSHAESAKVRDARQDVSRVDFSECTDSGECPEASSARNPQADVRRFSASLGPGSLRLVLRVAALSRKPEQRTIAGWEIRTSGRETWEVLIDRRQEKVRFQFNQEGEKDAWSRCHLRGAPRVRGLTQPPSLRRASGVPGGCASVVVWSS